MLLPPEPRHRPAGLSEHTLCDSFPLQALLQPYGVLEIARTGSIALSRDSGINTKMLNSRKTGRVML